MHAPLAHDDDDPREWLGLEPLFSEYGERLVVAGADFRLDVPGGQIVIKQDVDAFAAPQADADGAAPTEQQRTTGALLWDASVVLARALTRHPPPLPKRPLRVLELGAGRGLVGLALAAYGHHVTLTEHPSVLHLLRQSVDANARVLQGHGTIAVCALPWGDEPAAARLGPLDLVVCADCVYDTALVEPLIRTLRSLDAPRAVVAFDRAIGRHEAYAAFERQAARVFDRCAPWTELRQMLAESESKASVEVIMLASASAAATASRTASVTPLPPVAD